MRADRRLTLMITLRGLWPSEGSCPEHREVPQQGVSPLTVRDERFDVDATDEFLCLLGRLDHLGNQEHSRRIEQPGLRRHRVTQPLVQRLARDQVYSAPQRRAELVGEGLDVPAKRPVTARRAHRRRWRADGHRAYRSEDVEARHAVAPADLGDLIEVDIEASGTHGTSLRQSVDRGTACPAGTHP